jgi:hypothetical protein
MQGTILLSEQREEEKEENFTLFRETFLWTCPLVNCICHHNIIKCKIIPLHKENDLVGANFHFYYNAEACL